MATGASPLRLLEIAARRGWNIAFRTAHIAATGVLLGGHAFDVARDRLLLSLYVSLGTGAALIASEAGPGTTWFHQLRGLATLAKLALVASVALFWEYRLPILLGAVALASVGSHMPARFRYYSVLRGEVVRDGCGPGASRLDGPET